MLATLTGTGLAAAAGLNAYIPFVLVALLARFTDIIELPAQFAWIESTPAIVIASLLLVSEAVLDKIPVVDSINDTVGTIIRPVTGGLIFAATAAAETFENTNGFMQDNPWIAGIIGLVTAGVVHTGKATTRPLVNLGTGGVGAPVASTAEDGAALTLSLLAVFLPILVLVALVLMVWAVYAMWQKARRRRQAREAHATYIDPPTEYRYEGQ